MKESVAIAKDADAKKDFSSTRSDNSIHRVRNEQRQLGSLRSVIGNIRHDGGTPSLDSIATELSSMHTAQRASVLLALQRTHGNRYVQRVVTGIQAKLTIGQPGDKYEQEADRVAEQVMRMPEPQVQRQPEEEEEEELIQTEPIAEQVTPLVQRQIEEEKEEEEILWTKEVPGQTLEVTPDIESRIQALKGSGQPLPKSVRTFFEPRFGYDFSKVRIHSDARAAKLALALHARALTMGPNIAFGLGNYAPETMEGKSLLSHELTHVLQQSDVAPQAPLMVIEPLEVAEAEAAAVWKAAALWQMVGEIGFGSRLAVQFASEEAGKGTKSAVAEKGGKVESKEGDIGELYYKSFLKPNMERLWNQLHRKVEEHRRHLLALACLQEAAQPASDTLDVIRFCETYEVLKEMPIVGRIISFLEDKLNVPLAVTLGIKIFAFLRPFVETEILKAAAFIAMNKYPSAAGILELAESPKDVIEATKQKASEVSKLISEIEKWADAMKDIEAELGVGKEASGTGGK